MSVTLHLSSARRVLHISQPFELLWGSRLERATIGYERFGTEDGPVVVVQGGISADAHVAYHDDDPRPGWWDTLVGPGKPIDTSRFCVISTDWLGGCGASSGPWSHGAPFPAVAPADQAAAIAAVLDSLRVARIEAFVGASYGGMTALAFAERYGSRLRRAIAIGAAHRPDARAIAWRSLQRRMLKLSPEEAPRRAAMALARSLAMLTYRTRAELSARFVVTPSWDGAEAHFPIESYLEARGEAWAQSMDPESYRVLSQAIDLHAVDPSRIEADVLLIGARQDELVPIEDLWECAHKIRRGACVELDSIYGHDAFLKETAAVGALLRRALGGEAVR